MGAPESVGRAEQEERAPGVAKRKAAKPLKAPAAAGPNPENKAVTEGPKEEHRGCLKSDSESLERRSPSMKRKHTYQSVDVEAVDVAALVAAMVVACVVPGGLDLGVCIVALDVAKERFYAALSNARGEVVRILRFNHPQQTMAMLKLLLELKNKTLDVQVVLEPTGTYGDAVKYQCYQQGLAVYEVSPKRTHDMAEVLDGVPSMHDAKATVVLAQLHTMGKSRAWKPHSTDRRDLRALVDRRVLYSEPLEQHYGRLEALLARYWPEFGQVMSVRETRSWMALLSKYPGPEAVKQAGEDAKEVLRAAARAGLSAERIEEVIGACTQSLGVAMTSAERALLRELVDEIQRLSRKVDEIDKQIASWVLPDPIMKLMADVIGPAATAALMVYVGAPSQYASAAAYEKACGLNLKVRSSGKDAGRLKITKRGPPRVRQLMYLAALRCCQTDETVRAWYQQRKSYEASIKIKAVVAVMRKLVRALWCMGHDVEHPKAFDSHLLFDIRRLKLQPRDATRSSHGVNAPPPCSASPAQTGKRSGRISQPQRTSTVEAQP
jgi:transposase